MAGRSSAQVETWPGGHLLGGADPRRHGPGSAWWRRAVFPLFYNGGRPRFPLVFNLFGPACYPPVYQARRSLIFPAFLMRQAGQALPAPIPKNRNGQHQQGQHYGAYHHAQGYVHQIHGGSMPDARTAGKVARQGWRGVGGGGRIARRWVPSYMPHRKSNHYADTKRRQERGPAKRQRRPDPSAACFVLSLKPGHQIPVQARPMAWAA